MTTKLEGIAKVAKERPSEKFTVNEPDGRQTSYTYDAAGNRASETVIHNGNSSATFYTYNEQNRLMSTLTSLSSGKTQKVTYAYDSNGNMTSKMEETTKPADLSAPPGFSVGRLGTDGSMVKGISIFEYNVFNQLVKATTGTETITYGYNGEGLM